jgi:AraC-like DNA-binding protein
LALSKSKLYRELKVLTGYSPNQLLQEMKLRGAASDLLKGELPVSQVAYDNGFNSPTYFTRTFKLRFGMLPTELSHVH